MMAGASPAGKLFVSPPATAAGLVPPDAAPAADATRRTKSSVRVPLGPDVIAVQGPSAVSALLDRPCQAPNEPPVQVKPSDHLSTKPVLQIPFPMIPDAPVDKLTLWNPSPRSIPAMIAC